VDRRFEVHQVTDLKLAIAAAQKAESILLYFEVSKKEHIVNLIILLSAITPQLQKGLCKSIGFMLIPKGAEQIEAMLKQKGVTEVVPARTSEKGVMHKANRFYEMIQAGVQRKRGTATVGGSSGGGRATSVEWADPLKTPNDYWVLQKMSDIKFRRETWMLSLIGPPPSLGKWELDRPELAEDTQGNDPGSDRLRMDFYRELIGFICPVFDSGSPLRSGGFYVE